MKSRVKDISLHWLKLVEGDRQIWMVLIMLSLFSVPVVLSSINVLADKYDTSPFIFLGQHLRNISIALLIAFVCHRLPSKFYNQWALVIYVLSVGLLIYTALFADELNSARRWIDIPLLGMSFQPSDFAKVSLLMLLAQRISSKQLVIKKIGEAFYPIFLPVALSLVLIIPFDLSTALLLFCVVFAMMFVGRMNLGLLIGVVALGMVLFSGIYMVGEKYNSLIRSETWTRRVVDFVDTDAVPDHQVLMRNQAIGNGGLFGVGPGKGLNKNYFNSPFTDFIYAVICEEFGLLGALLVVLLYLWFFWRVVVMIFRSERAFGAILAFGLAFMIVLQAMVNMLVTLDMLPSTGIPLPMISLGGTSNMITGAAFGIILSISKDFKKEQKKRDEDESVG